MINNPVVANRSVTISSTAPNSVHWLHFRAKRPSNSSQMNESKYVNTDINPAWFFVFVLPPEEE
jgi:hypothetical protein